MQWFARVSLLAVAALPFVAPLQAVGEAPYVRFAPESGAFALVAHGAATPIVADFADFAGVVRAAQDLQADIERVSSVKPVLAPTVPPGTPELIVVGTLGHSPTIDALVTDGKLNVGPVRGRWESYVREIVADPWPGVSRALVIAGSDKRGTIYGIYDLSEQIGVSPWYWWADVTPDHHDALYVTGTRFVQPPPSVKYRGIFLNDEHPDLTNWVAAKFGTVPPRQDPPVPPGIANYNHEFYARIFEVLLRLKANYLWPAMWNNAFNEDDLANARLADEYGIVMGTSHQEPMLRAQKEWDRRYQKTIGTWNYAKNPELLESFWRDGIRRNKAFESIITIGLRGANDTEMAPGGPAANRELLEKIVARQRAILAEEMNPDLTRVPQLWCLYKEVQDYYESGMRAPDDVTLLWAEDNWGNVRRLPTAEEASRSGGAGVYYHFDYHGGPRNYQWVNTSPLPKIWDQMSLAKQYGADRIWIVNVGHFKGYEVPMEFFLNYAWDTRRWGGDNVDDFLRQWAAREFGAEHAGDIAAIVAEYAKFNGRRKPELLAPTTYSLTDYREAETVVADYDALAERAEKLMAQIPPEKHDAYYQLVYFPTKASALVNDLYLAAGRNALYAKQGRASANNFVVQTHELFEADQALMAYFNHDFAHGRWDHFMDQTHLGYTTWRDPPKNSLDAIKLQSVDAPIPAALGVAVDGADAAWPGGAGEPALPRFDAVNQQRSYFEVFNRGKTAFDFQATAMAPWIKLSATQGSIGPDQRVWVDIDWNAVPKGVNRGRILVRGADAEVFITVDALNPAEVSRETAHGFVEGARYVSIEPEHYTRKVDAGPNRWIRLVVHDVLHLGFRRKVDAGPNRWIRVADYGRTLSGMRAEAPAHALSITPGPRSPVLEYRVYLFDTGSVDVTAITSPTLNFVPDRSVRYAVSFDDQPLNVVTLVPKGYRAQNGNADWEKTVGDNARYSHSRHLIAQPGYHTLKLWMVDPAVVVQKLVIDLGGVKPSYLGPPESFHRMP